MSVVQAPIEVVPYDPNWIAAFEREKQFLEALLAPWRLGSIEHVGTSGDQLNRRTITLLPCAQALGIAGVERAA